MTSNTRNSQETYFRSLFHEHLGSPQAVSSESLEHKELRFREICKLFLGEPESTEISVHDVGMGLADLNQYISTHLTNRHVRYSGSDILGEYVEASRQRFPNLSFFHRDLAGEKAADQYDYVVLSGVFHQRRTVSIPHWEAFWETLLFNCWAMNRKGMAFNFVSPYVDYYQDNIYYCNIYKLLDFVASKLSRHFIISHNYALFEFTVFVYKQEFIRKQYPQVEFAKYFK